jgi:hypothetical protein
MIGLLNKARNIVSKGWTKGAYKRHRDDVATWIKYNWAFTDYEWNDHRCNCYCLAGALNKARGAETHADIPTPLAKVLGFRSEQELISWNDKLGRTAADVTRRIDRAIKRLRLAA